MKKLQTLKEKQYFSQNMILIIEEQVEDISLEIIIKRNYLQKVLYII